MTPIKHVWFDLEGTLTVLTHDFHKSHDKLRYETYSEATNRPVSAELIDEFEALYVREGSNSAVFRSLGLPSDYWMQHRGKLDPAHSYEPVQVVTDTLIKLRDSVPISLFTNFKLDITIRTLKTIGIDKQGFAHIITGDDVRERKPALDGFYQMIERSKLPADQILYVGDRVEVDIKPAKSLGIQTCIVWSESTEADFSFVQFQDLLTLRL